MTPNIAERVESLRKRVVSLCKCHMGYDCDNCRFRFTDAEFLLSLVDKYQKLVERADTHLTCMEPFMRAKGCERVEKDWKDAKKESGLFETEEKK